jgi:hypothetical protein
MTALRSLIACILLTACVSAPAGTSFNTTAGDALLVEATSLDRSVNGDVFRRVDLSTGRFVGDPVVLQIDAFAGLESLTLTARTQINSNLPARRVNLGIHRLPPGNYAWVETDRSIGNANYGASSAVCFHDLAPVFSIAAGEIAIIRADAIIMASIARGYAGIRQQPSGLTDDDVLHEFALARPSYPNIAGAAVVKHPVAYIHWAKTTGTILGLTRQCNEPQTFELTSTPATQ